MWTCGQYKYHTHVDMWTCGRVDTLSIVLMWTCGHFKYHTYVDMWTCGHCGYFKYRKLI